MTRLTFLGTGTSQGVPMIGSTNPVSYSEDKRDMRLRSSVLVQADAYDIVVDCGPDFRYQMLRAGQRRLDAVLFTHDHADHIAGLDDIRPFNYLQKMDIPVYGTKVVMDTIREHFGYIFVSADKKYPGAPGVKTHVIDTEPFMVNGSKIIPVPGIHGKQPVTGYRFDNIAYLTDFSAIPQSSYPLLKGLDVLVINALRLSRPHHSHFILPQALAEIEKIKPKMAYLTHINEEMGFYELTSKTLPENVYLAYDCLTVEV